MNKNGHALNRVQVRTTDASVVYVVDAAIFAAFYTFMSDTTVHADVKYIFISESVFVHIFQIFCK